jgi:hypothetical protein
MRLDRALAEGLARLVVADEAGPWCVVQYDPESKRRWVYGPWPSEVDAAVELQRLRDNLAGSDLVDVELDLAQWSDPRKG